MRTSIGSFSLAAHILAASVSVGVVGWLVAA